MEVKPAAKKHKRFKKFGGSGQLMGGKVTRLVDNPEEHVYTLEDVAKHRKRDDCWTVWKGKVYDMTSYVDKHPGGDKILAGAGKDCTKLYNKFHPWVNADYLIGHL